MKNIFSRLVAIPRLALAATQLQETVQSAQADPAIVAELKAHPELAGVITEFNGEWSAFKSDLDAMKKVNIGNFFGRLGKLVLDGTTLEANVEAVQHDAGIAASLKQCPTLSASIAEASAEWRQVEAAFDAIK